MKQINLVPVAVRQKAVNRQTIPLLVIAGLIGAGAAGAAWLAFSYQSRSLQNEKNTLIQEETEREQAEAKASADLQVDADLSSRVSTLNTLAKSDVDWTKVFTYVASLTPKDITLTNYSVATAQGIVLKLTGVAPSNVSYATFAEFLKDSIGKTLTAFTVDGYTYEPGTGAVTFSVTITVPPDSVKFSAS